jgi:hypothetical protein
MTLGAEFEHLGAFRCPKCGNDGSCGEIRFVEDIACYRPVVGVKNGGLEIDGLYRTDGYDDDATNQRFECRGRLPTEHYDECGHEWPVPPWLHERIDWI